MATDKITLTGGTLTATGLTVAVNPAGDGLTQTEYILVDATGGGTIDGTFAGLTGAPDYELNYDTSNQVKLVKIGGGTPFGTWATGGETFDGDANGDGVDDGLAWFLGAALPADNALGKLPVPTKDGAFLTLDFLRVNPYAPAKLYVQFGNDLSGWTEAEVPAATGTITLPGDDIEVEVTAGTPDSVKIKIPASYQSASGALFARLRATEN